MVSYWPISIMIFITYSQYFTIFIINHRCDFHTITNMTGQYDNFTGSFRSYRAQDGIHSGLPWINNHLRAQDLLHNSTPISKPLDTNRHPVLDTHLNTLGWLKGSGNNVLLISCCEVAALAAPLTSKLWVKVGSDKKDLFNMWIHNEVIISAMDNQKNKVEFR